MIEIEKEEYVYLASDKKNSKCIWWPRYRKGEKCL